MGGSCRSIPVVNPKTVSVTPSEKDNTTVSLLYTGGKDADTCVNIKAVLTPETGAVQTKTMQLSSTSILPISSTIFFNKPKENPFSGKDKLIVTAIFKDGSEYQVGNFLV